MNIKTYNGLVHLNGNLLAAIDLETTGTRAGYHEPIQIAVVPLDADLKPVPGLEFYHNIAPSDIGLGRADKRATRVHGLDLHTLKDNALSQGRVKDLLAEWFNKLELPFNKNIVPLAHNWAFECKFLHAWLGVEMAGEIFHSHARDAMLYALSMNDRSAFAAQPAHFRRVSLKALCRQFNVVNLNPHDAYCDAVAEAEVYRAMLMMDAFR